MRIVKSVVGTGSATVVPTGAVSTNTAVTVTFPNGVSGVPVALRASGSVSGIIVLQYGAGDQVQLPVNPNAPFTQVKIPSGAYKTPVSTVNLYYQAAGAGSIFIFVDYA